MKALITFALGFVIARQLYINFDKEEARKKEAQIKSKVKSLLREVGLSEREVEKATNEITTK